jgi:hypothetical protein
MLPPRNAYVGDNNPSLGSTRTLEEASASCVRCRPESSQGYGAIHAYLVIRAFPAPATPTMWSIPLPGTTEVEPQGCNILILWPWPSQAALRAPEPRGRHRLLRRPGSRVKLGPNLFRSPRICRTRRVSM